MDTFLFYQHRAGKEKLSRKKEKGRNRISFAEGVIAEGIPEPGISLKPDSGQILLFFCNAWIKNVAIMLHN
ncbi:MAG: hypothetical protein JXR72_05245 [Proteobacteria bacterium]|nr:hypothetical protein [Pseudomonadota bacterium]